MSYKNEWLTRKKKRVMASRMSQKELEFFKNNILYPMDFVVCKRTPDRNVYYIDIKDEKKADEFLEKIRKMIHQKKEGK